jgi:hypothetical protein
LHELMVEFVRESRRGGRRDEGSPNGDTRSGSSGLVDNAHDRHASAGVRAARSLSWAEFTRRVQQLW